MKLPALPPKAGLRFFIGLCLLNTLIFIKMDVKSRYPAGLLNVSGYF